MPAGRFADLAAAYERLKRRRGVVDFDDLLDLNLRAVETDAAFRSLVHWRFRHFFVDEAQDLNPLQHALLEAWRGGRADICLVGDPRQAIYGWNGSDHTTMTEVERVYPGVTVISLKHQLPMLAAGGQRRRCRTESPAVRSTTRRATAPTALHCASSRIRRSRPRPRRSPRSYAPHCNGTTRPASPCWREPTISSYRSSTHLSAAGIPTQRAVGRSPLEMALSDAYRTTSREALALWADEQFTHHDPIRRRVAEEVDRFLTSQEPGGFRSWVDARTPFDDLDVETDDGAVSLLTFHGAKGREWPVVIVAGAEDGLIPHSSAMSPRPAGRGSAAALRRDHPRRRSADHHPLGIATGSRRDRARGCRRSRQRSPTIARCPAAALAAQRASSIRSPS